MDLRKALLCILAAGAMSPIGFAAGQIPTKASVELRFGGTDNVARYDLMLPLNQTNRSLFFTDFRLVDTAGSQLEGSLGFGYRQHHPSVLDGGLIWGTYGYFDRLRTANNNFFNQFSIGGELFTNNWSMRANGYFPETDAQQTASTVVEQVGVQTSTAAAPALVNLIGTSLVQLSGTTTTATTTTSNVELTARERALRGFDAEIGRRWLLSDNSDFGVHGGYYRFSSDGAPRIDGPSARAELRFFDFFNLGGSEASFGVEWREDDVRSSEQFFSARMRIPFPIRRARDMRSTNLDRRMSEFVVRDVDIVTFADDLNATPGTVGGPSAEVLSQTFNTTVTTEYDESSAAPVVDPVSGESIDVLFVAADGSGNCTESAPCSLEQAESQSGAGDVIFLSNRNGAIGENITLKHSQQLLGTGDGTSVDVLLPDNLTYKISDSHGRGTLTPPVTGSRVFGGPSPECWWFGFEGCPLFFITYYDAGGAVITLANGSLVQGIGVTGGDIGVFGENVSKASIRDIFIANPTQGLEESEESPLELGIQLVNTSDISISSANIRNIRGSGIDIAGSTRINIQNNDMQRVRANDVVDIGVAFDRVLKGSGVDLREVTDITVSGNTIAGTHTGGVVAKGSLGLLRIDDNTMSSEQVSLTDVDRTSLARNYASSITLTNTNIASAESNVVPRIEMFGGSLILVDNETSRIRMSVERDSCLDLQGGKGELIIGRDLGSTDTLKLPGYTGDPNSEDDLKAYLAPRHDGEIRISDPWNTLPRAPFFLDGVCETP
jgi:hypothetical protein